MIYLSESGEQQENKVIIAKGAHGASCPNSVQTANHVTKVQSDYIRVHQENARIEDKSISNII